MVAFDQGVPKKELSERVSMLQDHLPETNMDGALILQKADMFYFSGTAQQGWLYIPGTGKPILMIFKEFERAKAESGLERIVSIASPRKIPETLIEYGYTLPAKLGLELDVITANHYIQFQDIFSPAVIKDISSAIRMLRAVKSGYEIGLIRKSARMADKVAAKVPELIRPEMTEIEFAGLVEAYARKLGHQGLIRMRMWGNDLFYGHIMCGADAAVPGSLASPTSGKGVNPTIAQGPSFHKIKRNEPVLMDYVFSRNGYLSDHTRIYSFGKISDELLKAHDDMLKIQEIVKQNAGPGTVTGELYDLMIRTAKDMGHEDYFMGANDRKIRFTGHGLGLELDEFPFIAKDQTLKLAAGMTMALEPKVVIPQKGTVGIENTFLVTRDGLESLTTYTEDIVSL